MIENNHGKSKEIGMQTFDQTLYQLLVEDKSQSKDAMHELLIQPMICMMLKTQRGDTPVQVHWLM